MKLSPKLQINKADRQAAKQTGYPALFYTIQRTYGTDKAQIYLQKYREAQQRH